MITTKGESLIIQYLAGRIQSWAAAVEIGIGETPETVGDTSLEFPYLRVPVDNLDFDANTSKVIVRATLPQEIQTGVYEVGLFTSENFPFPLLGNRLFLTYMNESGVYTLDNAVYDDSNSRLGSEGLLISHASGTGSVRGYINQDLSKYKGADSFNLAYNSGSAGPAGTVVRFETTPSDYFEHTFSPSFGYFIESWTKNSMTQVGSPDWSRIDSIYVQTGTGVAELLLDGIMIEESVAAPNYGMVARKVLTTPRLKPAGVEAELTFEIGLTF